MNQKDSTQRVHLWHQCHHCEMKPIEGKRYHCKTCPDGPDSDLCSTCYPAYKRGECQHPSPDSFSVAAKVSQHRFQVHEGLPMESFTHWLDVPHPAATSPNVPDGFLVRPEFRAGREISFASYAFVARLDPGSQPLLLTALHVMDELIKANSIDTTAANQAYTGRELPSLISEVKLYDVLQTRWMLAPLGSAGPMLVLPGARTGDEEPNSARDIAAFTIKQADTFQPAILASGPPAMGDPVWLAVKVSPHGSERAMKAVVVEIREEALVFRFERTEEGPRYASGSPLLDRHGQVVGINVGRGYLKGHMLGHANHVGNIRRHLRMALLA